MESQQPSPPANFLKKNKIALTATLVVGIIIAATAFFFFKKEKPNDYNQKYSKYIESYTSGTVSKKSFIRVHLSNQVKTLSDVGVPDNRDLFNFSPSVKGKTYWIDAQTVEF